MKINPIQPVFDWVRLSRVYKKICSNPTQPNPKFFLSDWVMNLAKPDSTKPINTPNERLVNLVIIDVHKHIL